LGDVPTLPDWRLPATPQLFSFTGNITIHRLSAAMFTVGFSCPVLLPILGGYAWDATGVAALALASVALGGSAIIALAQPAG